MAGAWHLRVRRASDGRHRVVGMAGLGSIMIEPISHIIAAALEARFIPEPNSGCHLWLGAIDSDGYGRLSAAGEKRIRRAHRAAWEIVNGPIPSGLFVCHRCDQPSCVNAAHLFIGTPADNNADMKRKGRRSRALGRPWKLTEEDVRSIIADRRDVQSIATAYGVDRSYVAKIRKGTRCAHRAVSRPVWVR
jgi:hypothetical protein